ncbi:Putative P-loop containing nucleoside triphosphate hydrolase [Colletotrichum destructivum]|uniref:P-loop containing nucleoside triphosphate hydrolase n=1 Tax=Colletotrichum destructivum TaxID=34406 RepID=A0AAX4J4L4_9PEZI|nr:Putative P-loop containing nucleoside triphosphate hydrolase [Colletotrichum destructivum]
MDAVAERAKEIGKEAAEDGVCSIFQYVRSKVQRFMTRTSGAPKAEPTPMDWILEMRTMGLKIQYDTPIRGHVDWIKDEILFRRAQFGMGQLSNMMHGLVQEAREMLAKLTMTGKGEKLRQALLAILWASVEDDHSEQRLGYLFLRDERNAADNARQEVFDPTARRAYKHAFGQFRKRLWLLMHMLSSQPRRATELAGIQHSNTANGGVQNVFAHKGLMCFVTAYHKGFRSTGQAKVIHQYLLQEADKILLGARGQQDKEIEQVGSTSTDDGSDDGTDETAAWTSQLLRSQLNVSMWRHIAIAIANQYLNEAFGRPSEGGPDEDDKADNVDDSPLVYARLMMQFGSRTAAKQQQFRQISQQWHQFFDFSAEDRKAGAGAGSRTGAKRQAEPYDGVRTEARLRRQGRLQQADLEGQLRQMAGAPGATFQGNQAQAVRAIVDRHSPVVQIMGTGGSKSVSFMLPAFCSPDGVTIVVTPLVSLRLDLHVCCNKARIQSKGFYNFILQLQARQALDWIVLNKCYIVLEGNATFQLKLQEVGAAVREFGVQTTTQKNVQYLVVGVKSNSKGREDAVKAKVEQLGKMLGCLTFFSSVNLVEGKAVRLET